MTIRRTRPIVPSVALVGLLLSVTACDVLEVGTPDAITPGDLESPAGIDALRAGAIGDFYRAHTSLAVTAGGTLADEWEATGFFAFAERNVDLRLAGANNPFVGSTYLELHRARSALEAAVVTLSENGGSDQEIGALLTLAGFTYIDLAETFCSGVPISEFSESGPPQFGVPLTTEQVYDRALERFGSALARPIDATLEALALVGRSRALLGLGDLADAGTVAQGVPTAFIRFTEHVDDVTARTRNGIYFGNGYTGLLGVGDRDGGNGLAFASANDPRVPVIIRVPDVGDFPTRVLATYSSFGDRVTLASGIEARLIEAEAALADGAPATMVTTLQALRDFGTTQLGLDFTQIDPSFSLPVADQGTPDGNVDLLFQERAFWLFSTGRRLGDLRRLVRQYGRDPETVFPTGVDQIGTLRGTAVNLPVSTAEENNPQFTGCIDRDA